MVTDTELTKGVVMTVSSEEMTSHQYAQWRALRDTSVGYPANHFAFQQVLNVLTEEGCRSLLEVGVGHGYAIPIFAGAGFAVSGFEIDLNLVAKSKGGATALGLNPEAFTWGDIRDSTSYPTIRSAGPFDALLAMGVLPHVENDEVVLANMRALVKPGGLVFVECRNSLFSLITFNRYTHEFILDELLADAPAQARSAVDEYLRDKVAMDRPPAGSGGHASRFHNPLVVPQTFAAAGFTDIVVRPFHYHAAMPALEASLGQAFRDGSIALENEPSGWRGLFLCSAFIVQARRPESAASAPQANDGGNHG